MLKGKKILLGISGSIAAYKSALLIRLLIKAGAEVKVVMTSAATQFIGPLTLSTLSKNKVLVDLSSEDTWANHVMLGRWADVMLIAPLSCNTLSKMTTGACDNLLMAVYLSATCPVVVAPAMDEDMWHHPSTQKNLQTLTQFGNHIIPVEDGELASGLIGMGRMAEPESIISWLTDFFKPQIQLLNKNVLITAGPTHEPIDPVRFIGNHASGKMGIALAIECKKRGANVTLVCGPTSESIPENIHLEFVKTANEMYDKCHTHFSNSDIAIMAAAVADYTIKSPSEIKIKKAATSITLELEKTKDILKSLGEIKKENQILVGFALETNNEIENAISKLKSKNADFIVLNSLNDAGAGFGHQTNKITIFDKVGNQYNFDQKLKSQVAADILNTILNINHV
jgi:phosphopantothenoylcysteine decarboxylase/phosphopantothenate--cysteine ligase